MLALARAAAVDRARHCLRTAGGAPDDVADAYLDEWDALRFAHDIALEEAWSPPRRPTLVSMTSGRFNDIGENRRVICDAIRSAAYRRRDPAADERTIALRLHAPRWRRGSNSWRPNAMRQLRDEREPEPPCPHCGVPAEDRSGGDGIEVCGVCHNGWVVGDYDRTSIADCERFARDLAADDVEDIDRCRRCDRLYDKALHAVVITQVEPFCASAGCPFGGDLALFDPFAAIDGDAPDGGAA